MSSTLTGRPDSARAREHSPYDLYCYSSLARLSPQLDSYERPYSCLLLLFFFIFSFVFFYSFVRRATKSQARARARSPLSFRYAGGERAGSRRAMRDRCLRPVPVHSVTTKRFRTTVHFNDLNSLLPRCSFFIRFICLFSSFSLRRFSLSFARENSTPVTFARAKPVAR